ncbi:hypothetical protein RRG08_058782 [Elysia crispata]|uniref:Uncharacterized protein n=1 Tax=Elysia crispata TaxID=231223 RepID=A0AAE0YWU6_9GAST|nr:hypothetical protein RRG08_058782 [Elysia crispata]
MSRSPQASQLSLSIQIRTAKVDHHKLHNSHYLFRSERQESITTSFTTLTIYSDQNGMSRSPQASQLSLSIQIRTTRVDHHKLHNSHYLFRSEPQESITTSFTTLTIYSDQNGMSRSPQASQLSLSIQIRTARVDHHKLHNSHYLFRSERQESITTSFTTLSSQYLFRSEPQESITTSFTTLSIYSDQNGMSRSPQASQLSLSIQIRTTRVDHHKLHNSHYLFRSERHESITTSFTTLTIYSDQNHKSRSPQASQLSLSIQIRTARVDHHKLHNSHYLFRSERHESISTSFTTLTIYSDQNGKSRSPQASQLSLSIQIRTA